MRRVQNCHKVCSLFGTGSALQLVSEVGWLPLLLKGLSECRFDAKGHWKLWL